MGARAKHQSVSRNVKARAKTSKIKPNCQSSGQNVRAWAENVRAWAKTSKREPKCQSASQNFKALAKMSKCKSKRKPKLQSSSRNVKAQAKSSKHKPKCQSASHNVKARAKTSKLSSLSLRCWKFGSFRCDSDISDKQFVFLWHGNSFVVYHDCHRRPVIAVRVRFYVISGQPRYSDAPWGTVFFRFPVFLMQVGHI